MNPFDLSPHDIFEAGGALLGAAAIIVTLRVNVATMQKDISRLERTWENSLIDIRNDLRGVNRRIDSYIMRRPYDSEG